MRKITLKNKFPTSHLELLVLGVIVEDNHVWHPQGGFASVEDLYDEGGRNLLREYCTKQLFLKIIKKLAAEGLIVIRRFMDKEIAFVAGWE